MANNTLLAFGKIWRAYRSKPTWPWTPTRKITRLKDKIWTKKWETHWDSSGQKAPRNPSKNSRIYSLQSWKQIITKSKILKKSIHIPITTSQGVRPNKCFSMRIWCTTTFSTTRIESSRSHLILSIESTRWSNFYCFPRIYSSIRTCPVFSWTKKSTYSPVGCGKKNNKSLRKSYCTTAWKIEWSNLPIWSKEDINLEWFMIRIMSIFTCLGVRANWSTKWTPWWLHVNGLALKRINEKDSQPYRLGDVPSKLNWSGNICMSSEAITTKIIKKCRLWWLRCWIWSSLNGWNLSIWWCLRDMVSTRWRSMRKRS